MANLTDPRSLDELSYHKLSLDELWKSIQDKKDKKTSSRFDTEYRKKEFPYEVSLTIKNESKELKGGAGFNESHSILYFLNNLQYGIIETNSILETKEEKYRFKVNDELNKKIGFGSKYISSGYFSSAIAINQIIDSDKETQLPPLVLKIKFIINKSEDQSQRYNTKSSLLFRRLINKFSNCVPKCYFFGDKIIKKNYEPGIINDEYECNKPANYDELFANKQLTFGIYKYYTQELPTFDIKKYILLKVSIYLYHFRRSDFFVNDLKYDNIGYDDNYNIINIDYDGFTYGRFKTGDKYIIWKIPIYIYMFSCDIKKRLYTLLKLGSEETVAVIKKMVQDDTRIYSHVHKDNEQHKYNNAVTKLLIDSLNGNYSDSYASGIERYLTDYNLKFEKFNAISIFDIILGIFFKEINVGKLLYWKEMDGFKLNSINFNLGLVLSGYISSFQNINDIELLTRFIYKFIQPVDGIDKEYIVKLKFLILDPITETGIMGTDFESVPPYELIAKKFKDINKDDTPIYDQFKQMIDDNIGTPKVLKKTVCDYEQELNDNYKITNVGDDVKAVLTDLGLLHESFDTISYEEWQLSILVEKLMDRPENRSDTSLDLPCVNSTLPQNYIFTIDKISCETTKTIKWAKNDEEVYVETPEYRIIKRQLLSGECTQEKTKHHEELDKMNERIFARCIVSFLKGTPIISEGLTGYLLGKVDLLRTFDRRKYIRLATVQKPVKKVWESKSVRQKKESMKQEMKSNSGSTKETSIKPDLSLEWKRRQPIGKGPIGEKADLSKWERGLSIKTAEYKYLKYKNKYLELKNKIDI